MRRNIIHDSQYTSRYTHNVYLSVCVSVRTQLPANKSGILSLAVITR